MPTVGTKAFALWVEKFTAAFAARPKPRKVPFECEQCRELIAASMGYPNGRCPRGVSTVACQSEASASETSAKDAV